MKAIKLFIIAASTIFVLFLAIASATPFIAKSYINKHSKELTGRQIHINGLYANIFTGYIRITGFNMLEQNEKDSFINFDTLAVDLSLYRLFGNELRINEIKLINPNLKLLQNQNHFNFDDFLALGQTEIPANSLSDSIPGKDMPTDSLHPSDKSGMTIALYNIAIRNGNILYHDLVRNSVWQIENFGLAIPGVYFSGANTDVGINLDFYNGGSLQTAIQYNLEAGNYNLNLKLNNLPISNIHPYLTDYLNINNINGLFSTDIYINGNTQHITDLSFKGVVGLDSLYITDKQNNEVMFTDRIRIEMNEINPGEQIYDFNSIAVNGIKTNVDLYTEGNTISNLFKPEIPGKKVSVTEPNIPTDTPPVKPTLKINQFRLTESLFTFNDKTLCQPFSLSLENINITADNLTLDGNNQVKITSTLKNGGTITLNWKGILNDISNQNLFVGIKNLDLKAFTPYSLEYFGYPVQKGILSFSSANNIKDYQLDARNSLNIARCEVANKQKIFTPQYNIPLKTALYLIKDVHEQINIQLPVKGNISSPEFSYKKIIFKTFLNLLVKVSVSPFNFLAGSLGFSPDQLKNISFDPMQNDFTPEQLSHINQLAEIVRAKPEMTLVLEQSINIDQSKKAIALFEGKKRYFLYQHPEKNGTPLLPADHGKIYDIASGSPDFITFINNQVREELKTADLNTQLLSLSNDEYLLASTIQLADRRNTLLANYLIRQGITDKNIKINTAPQEKLSGYKSKSQYSVNLIFESDEQPSPELPQNISETEKKYQ